jgi:Fic family protein
MSEDHPVTRAALLQLVVYNLKAFPSLNEPFSHLAFQLALTWSGWNLRGFVCIEEQYFHDRAYYKELIRNTYASGNVTQWIEYVSEVFINQLDHIIETYSVKQHSSEAKNENFIINDRQKKILELLDEPNSSINNRSLQKMTGISQMTAARDLAKLVEHGLIVSHGKGRGVTYTRN